MMTRLFVVLLLCLFPYAHGDVAVLTQHNDLSRTGANLQETILNSTNVNVAQFGLLFTRTVDDQIYAQPLIMTNVDIPGKGAHNVAYVATVNDTVYAFDADDPAAGVPYWQVSFTNANAVPPRNTDMTGACGGNYKDFSGNMGIVGTPVIDPVAGTIYLVARTREYGTNFVQKLHALDLRTGAERANSPVVITATYGGTGDGSVNNVLTFDPQRQNQRPALALVNGVVYIGWASHCDWGPYHGWLIGYDATNLQRVIVYNTTPNGYNGGIWMGGQGLAADASGNLYVSVGNGTVGYSGDPRNTTNRGESFLKLTRNDPGLNIASWFTPYNWQDLENSDLDLGSAGILLIPGSTLAFSAGKQGKAYLVNRDNMGGLSATTADTNIVQSFQVSSQEIFGSPVWWDGPTNSWAYLWGSADYLRQYRFDRAAGTFQLPNFAQSPTPAPAGEPGGMLALSANSTNAGSGILWASHQFSGDANQQVRPGILHAYNAQNVANELWNSEQLSARDFVGNFAKFCPATVANGKVYLATFSGRLNVYGLLSTTGGGTNPPNASITTPTNGASFLALASFTITATASVTDTNRSIAKVEIFDGTNLLGTLTSAPYLLSVSNVAAGAHYLVARATDSSGAYRTSVPVVVQVTSPVGTGTGLAANYFNNKTLTAPSTVNRVDATINFNWGSGSPDPSIGSDNFSVRWQGYVQPQITETFTFYTTSDDGVRLWVNNMLIIDNWTDHGATEDSGALPLIAGQKYAVKMEFYENGGAAVAQLRWSSLSTPKTIIPQSQLYTNLPTLTVAATADAQEGTGQQGVFTVTRSGDASGPLTANFTLGGSAAPPADYGLNTAGNQVSFTNSQTTATIVVIAVNDLLVEGSETVQLGLANSLNYFVGAPGSAALTIFDSPFDQWRVAQFGSIDAAQGTNAAPGADWDNDGLGNFVEYSLGLNPMVPDTNGLPKGRLFTDAGTGQRYLTLEVARNPSATDAIYAVEVSSYLTNWLSGPPYTVELTNTPAQLSVRDAQPVSANPQRFLRLKVSPRP